MSNEKKKSYYARNRERILKKMNEKYQKDLKYREATKRRARERYHQDEAYRKATIERAKARYRRLKNSISKNTQSRANQEEK